MFSTLKHAVFDGVSKGSVEKACGRHYERFEVFENKARLDNWGDKIKGTGSGWRIHIRTDKIGWALIYDLEQLGLRCETGTTCNEWETSLYAYIDKNEKEHPTHMPATLTRIPEDLKIIAPQWYAFLQKVDFLGHLMGKLSNGITVPKQAFGHCDTSIVLEAYKRAYGENDFKSHQCNTCIDHELGFRDDINSHSLERFQDHLEDFVQHFKQSHPELWNQVQTSPFVKKNDEQAGHYLRDFDKRMDESRYSTGYL